MIDTSTAINPHAYREMVARVFAALGRRPRLLTVPFGRFAWR